MLMRRHSLIPAAARLTQPCGGPSQAGLTLVELMVAMAIGLAIALAAAGALVVARQGFTSVDSTAQLRENARFSADLMQRIIVQAGFENVAEGHHTKWKSGATEVPAFPGIRGIDNAWVTLASMPTVTVDSRPTGCAAADTSCANGSDVLVVRYWGVGAVGAADGSMINCAGIAEPEKVGTPAVAMAYSVFHVTRSADNEPTLSCSYIDPADNTWKSVELVKGVEGLQVLYGVDGVTPTTAPPAGNGGQDGTADRYLTARQMTVAGNAAATDNNWRRVRSLRIGMLFRGDVGSAADRAATAATWDVLGLGASVTTPADIGAQLTVAADGRLRHSLVFTVHLRNQQGFEVN